MGASTTSTALRLRSVATRYRTGCRLMTSAGTRMWPPPPPARRRWRLRSETKTEVDEEDPLVRQQRLEAILFLAREPLTSRRLAMHAGLADGTEARTLIRSINQQYDERGHAFCVEEVAGGYQLRTRGIFAPWLRRLEHVPREVRLSAPAMETLAVVAYRQPVLRADIEAIRGVNCGEILRQLMERDLVRIGGRSEELGRPYLYTTTRRFLEIYGLRNLDQLPMTDVFQQGLLAEEEPSQPVDTEGRLDPEQVVSDDEGELDIPGAAAFVPFDQPCEEDHPFVKEEGADEDSADDEEE